MEPLESVWVDCILAVNQGFQKDSKWRANKPIWPFLQLTKHFQVDAWQEYSMWSYSRFIEIQSSLRRKKLHRKNEGSNFIVCSLSIRDNLRVPIQKRKTTPASWNHFFLKNKFINIHLISTSVIRLVEQKKLSFPALKSIVNTFEDFPFRTTLSHLLLKN